MTSQRSVVFAEPVRTAIGTFGGSLKDVPAPSLGAVAIGAAVARAAIRPEEVETIVMGNVVQAGSKMNPARQAAVHAGLPVTIPALTVNRVCGSGAQAIVSAAQEIALGNINVAVAGGMENMDQAPYLIARGRWGYRMGDGALYDNVLRPSSQATRDTSPKSTPRNAHTPFEVGSPELGRHRLDSPILMATMAPPLGRLIRHIGVAAAKNFTYWAVVGTIVALTGSLLRLYERPMSARDSPIAKHI